MKIESGKDWQHGGFGLYVHWPFCQSKCPYCDFNSHVSSNIDMAVWKDRLLSEMRRYALETTGRVLKSIFFGGGTPSLMDPGLVAALIEEARLLWTPANDIEVTLEANPTSIEVGRFQGYRDAGVNRVSIGIQALRDDDLRRLGRMHTVREALRGLEVAQSVFERVSFDLIYGRQGQTLSDWRVELTEALAIAPGHLSLYHLTIEDGTVFGHRNAQGRLFGLPGEDLSADLFEFTQNSCEDAAMPAYEISNHAAPGNECRHNMIYWTGGDYVGIGPGAHGRITRQGARYATVSEKMPARWLALAASGSAEVERARLRPEEQGIEYLMMGLRTRQGIDINRYQRLSGLGLPEVEIDSLREYGMIEASEHILKIAPKGRILMDSVLSRLIVGHQLSESNSTRANARQRLSSCSSD